MKMKTKIILLMLCSVITLTTVSAQKSNKKNNKKIIVSGYVTDQDKNPVANAMVLVDGKNTDKVTNEIGYYKIKISPDVLKISILTSSSGAVEEIVNGRKEYKFYICRFCAGSASQEG